MNKKAIEKNKEIVEKVGNHFGEMVYEMNVKEIERVLHKIDDYLWNILLFRKLTGLYDARTEEEFRHNIERINARRKAKKLKKILKIEMLIIVLLSIFVVMKEIGYLR